MSPELKICASKSIQLDSTSEKKTLIQLKNHKNIIFKATDKNWGPAAMRTPSHIQQSLQEHLLTT
jgi:hypothetical protein